MPATAVVAIAANQAGNPLTGLPPVTYSARPVAADIVASVAMNGCIRPNVTRIPFTRPQNAPSARPISSASTKGSPAPL